MNFVWNFDGVKVSSVTMNRWDGQHLPLEVATTARLLL